MNSRRLKSSNAASVPAGGNGGRIRFCALPLHPRDSTPRLRQETAGLRGTRTSCGLASPTCLPPPGILQAVWCPFLYGIGPFGGPGTRVDAPAGGATMTPKRNQETKMSIGTKFALCAAIVVSTAATASAATKKQKTTAHRSGVHVQTSVRRPAPPVNPFSPAATGGGTP